MRDEDVDEIFCQLPLNGIDEPRAARERERLKEDAAKKVAVSTSMWFIVYSSLTFEFKIRNESTNSFRRPLVASNSE